jgi:chromosome segregation ATPase
MELDLKAASEKLNIAIKTKNALDIVNNELKEDLKKCKEELKAQEETNTKQRLDAEYWRGKVIELERENLLGESQKNALEKESEITKNSLNEKIKMLEERISIEIETKDSLIIQTRKEEKSHSETRNALLKVASELEDYKLRYKNTKHILESKNKALDELITERSTLQANLLKMESEKDMIKLEVDKNIELLKQLEIFYKTKLETRKAKIKGLKKVNSLNEVQAQLIQEDLYSRCAQVYNSLNEYTTRVLL